MSLISVCWACFFCVIVIRAPSLHTDGRRLSRQQINFDLFHFEAGLRMEVLKGLLIDPCLTKDDVVISPLYSFTIEPLSECVSVVFVLHYTYSTVCLYTGPFTLHSFVPDSKVEKK